MQGFDGLAEGVQLLVQTFLIGCIVLPLGLNVIIGSIMGFRLPRLDIVEGAFTGLGIGAGTIVAACIWSAVAFVLEAMVGYAGLVFGLVLANLAGAGITIWVCNARSGRREYEEFSERRRT